MNFDWKSLLTKENSIIQKIKEDWSESLTNSNLKEKHYQNFLAECPGFFLDPYTENPQIISKLKLGSDYETDFVIVREGYSNGTIFEFVEIESPYSPPYTKHGIPSNRLTTAIQQVSNWRNWIDHNRSLFTRMMGPSRSVINNSNLKFTIIIGNRENSKMFLEERNNLSHKLHIEIRSFEYLSDNLKKKCDHIRNTTSLISAEMSAISYEVQNELANPFFMATSDSDWKKMVRRFKASYHHYSNNVDLILSSRKYNKYFDMIKNENT
jgi:hypothetical protein